MQMKLIVTGFSFPGLFFAKEKAFSCANTDLDEFQIYTLVILFSIQDRKLLRISYNILILSLAVADILTAINLISNPAFVLGDAFPYPSNPILSDIFCRVIWSRMLLFQLLVFSAYICLGLVTERWYAVIRQFKYSNTFNKKRTFIYIFAVGLLSLVLCCSTFFEAQYVSSSPTGPCIWWLSGKNITRWLESFKFSLR